MTSSAAAPQFPQGSFTFAAGRRQGFSANQLRGATLLTPSRGIRLSLQESAEAAENLRGYTDLDSSSVVTHNSGAQVWHICLPTWLQEDWRIHVARPAQGWKPRRKNVVGHQLTFLPGEVVMVAGARVTSPARTWLDLASVLSLDDLVAAGDSIVVEHSDDFPVPKEPLAHVSDLRRMVAVHPGMRGVKRARLALDLIRVGADSAPETHMRLALERAGLPEPELNVVLFNGLGHSVLWPDAAYPEQKVALQYDGAHHGDPDQYRRDIRRQAITESLGWREVRVQKSDLDGDRPFVVEKVKAALYPNRFGGTWPRTGS